MFRAPIVAGLLWLGVHSIASGDEPAPAVAADKIERLALSLTPAAEPRPALRYSLWRDERARQPGNGATFYYRAMLIAQTKRDALHQEFPAEKVDTWLTTPLADFPAEDVAGYIAHHRYVLQELETAAARETCHWDLRLDQLQGTEVISFLLPDFQNMRDLARIVAYKARYEVSQGQHEEAVRTLQLGYQMARDAAEPPLLINALIGMAIANQMHLVALDLIDSPGSPNLYWALKQLPHPLIEIRPSLRFEMAIPFRIFPFLEDAETAQRTPADWQRLTQETLTNLNALAGDVGQAHLQDWQVRWGATALILKAYPVAKQQLIAGGLDQAAVEQMPVAQVIAIHAARNYRYTYEEVFKWSLLPYPEAHARMRQSLDRLKSEGYINQPFSDKDVLPIASLLMPSVDSVLLASARVERRLAALETIEAIRLHAAARQGELPASLEELPVAPAAKNPFTGQHFDYRVVDGRAELEERAPGVDPVRANDRIYLIELIQDIP